MDNILYALIIYVIYEEIRLSQSYVSDSSVDDGVTMTLSHKKDFPDTYYSHFLGESILNREEQVEVQTSHFILIGGLLFKEILIYLFSVRRAYDKINKEIIFQAYKKKSQVAKSDADDNFKKQRN